jgi:predicted dehydrogenase
MFHVKAINSLDNIQVLALSDLNPKRMRKVKKITGAERCYTSYQDLLKDEDIRAVTINTPPELHEKMASDALNAGKHVQCEKPLARSIEGCETLKRIRDQQKLVLLPVHNYAFTPSLFTMENLIDKIGLITKTEISFENNLRFYRSETDFRTSKINGIVEDVFPHILSVALPFTGAAIEVQDISWSCKSYDVCDNLTAKLETEKGPLLECDLSWTRLIPRFRIRVEGEEGSLETELMLSPYTVIEKTENGTRKLRGRGLGWYLDLIRLRHPGFTNQYKHLLEMVKGVVDKPRVGIDDEMAMIRMIDRVSGYLEK